MKKSVQYLLFEGFSNVGFSVMTTVLTCCTRDLPLGGYAQTVHSLTGNPVTGVNGLYQAVDSDLFSNVNDPDYLVLLGGWSHDSPASNVRYLQRLRRCFRFSTTIVAISPSGTGLAASGLADGRRLAVNWREIKSVHDKYPNIKISENIYEIDGRILSCAAGSSTYNLAHHIVHRDYGSKFATLLMSDVNFVASHQVYQQLWHSISAEGHTRNTLAKAISIATNNVDIRLTAGQLAQKVGVSPRQLHRLFKSNLGETTIQFLNTLQLNKAREALCQTNDGIANISDRFGFSSHSYFCQAYKKQFGYPPAQERKNK